MPNSSPSNYDLLFARALAERLFPPLALIPNTQDFKQVLSPASTFRAARTPRPRRIAAVMTPVIRGCGGLRLCLARRARAGQKREQNREAC